MNERPKQAIWALHALCARRFFLRCFHRTARTDDTDRACHLFSAGVSGEIFTLRWKEPDRGKFGSRAACRAPLRSIYTTISPSLANILHTNPTNQKTPPDKPKCPRLACCIRTFVSAFLRLTSGRTGPAAKISRDFSRTHAAKETICLEPHMFGLRHKQSNQTHAPPSVPLSHEVNGSRTNLRPDEPTHALKIVVETGKSPLFTRVVQRENSQ